MTVALSPSSPGMPEMPEHMARALGLAAERRMATPPNPSVGCVIADAQGQLLGQGATQPVGGAHAEIMALDDARQRGNDVRKATAYVTLEPCSHHGRTGPCCDALVRAGISRVVASIADPNPLVSGAGFARLRAAGVAVEVGAGAHAARELNLGFFSRMVRKKPWVRMKVAASLDGQTALENGTSQWITSTDARSDGHAWRARACTVLTGIGTVLEDDPRLDVRLAPTPRQPTLAVVDSRLETPPTAQLFLPERQVVVYAAVRDTAREAALVAAGAEIVHLPDAGNGGRKVDLHAMLHDLARREVNELHVEAGHKLSGSLVRESLVDELLVYLAPKLIGQGRSMASFGPLSTLDQAVALEFLSTLQIGPDLRLLARVAGRDRF